MGSTMTDKTEAQPEALRLADERPYSIDDDLYAWSQSAEQVIRAQHAEIQQLKAQLSARQAAPDGWRLVPVEPTDAMLLTLASDGEAEVIAKHPEWHPMLLDRSGVPQRYAAMLSATPPPPEREPQKHEENRELAETAMRFVDRAGDVHPGVDDADRICAEFHAAMAAVVEKWHPTPLPTKRPSPQHEPSSLKADLEQFWKSVEDGSVFDVSPELTKQLDRILEANPNIADGICKPRGGAPNAR